MFDLIILSSKLLLLQLLALVPKLFLPLLYLFLLFFHYGIITLINHKHLFLWKILLIIIAFFYLFNQKFLLWLHLKHKRLFHIYSEVVGGSQRFQFYLFLLNCLILFFALLLLFWGCVLWPFWCSWGKVAAFFRDRWMEWVIL